MMVIDYSGKRGDKGEDGQNGCDGKECSPGGHGQDGKDGKDGEHGEHIDLRLSTHDTRILIDELTKKRFYDSITLGDRNASLRLLTQGGRGGDGGVGGQGGKGGQGHIAKRGPPDAIPEVGTDGFDGGNSGNGGSPGIGGDGGTVTIAVNESDMDLLMIIAEIQTNCGSTGHGGWWREPGKGGEAGSGLQYQWGLKEGKKGKNGISGSQKKQSTQIDGQTIFNIEGVRYSKCYNLTLVEAGPIQSDDGILEPGERIQVTSFKLVNNGGMPTPSNRRIAIGFRETNWVYSDPNDTITISEPLKASQNLEINHPLNMTIKDFTGTAIGDPFRREVLVNYDAIVERVNRPFLDFDKQHRNFSIRFPVEFTIISLENKISEKKPAAFAVQIWNQSSKPIGLNTKEGRLLNFRFILKGTQKIVEFIMKEECEMDNNTAFNEKQKDKLHRNSLEQAVKARSKENYISQEGFEENQILIDQEFITELPANSKKTISGYLKLIGNTKAPKKPKSAKAEETAGLATQPLIQINSKIPLEIKLDLGYIHDMQNTFHNVHSKQFEIQVVEDKPTPKKYSYNKHADFLLVYHSEQIQNELVESMIEFSQAIGSDTDVWEVNQHKGFSFDFVIPQEQQPLSSLYRNKVLILLSSENVHPNKLVFYQNIYAAAKSLGIASYIINGTQTSLNDFFLWYPGFNPKQFIQTGPLVEDLFTRFFSDQISSSNKRSDKRIQQNDPSIPAPPNISEFKCNTYGYEYIKKYRILRGEPNQDEFKAILSEVKNGFLNRNPRFFHLITHDFNIQLVKKKIFSKLFSLGHITATEGLHRDFASIILKSTSNAQKNLVMATDIDAIDQFSMIKLLKFPRKLEILERALIDAQLTRVILSAIFSDLADEYITLENNSKNPIQQQNTFRTWDQLKNFKLASSIQAVSTSINSTSGVQANTIEITSEKNNINKKEITTVVAKEFIRFKLAFSDYGLQSKMNESKKICEAVIDQILSLQLEMSAETIKLSTETLLKKKNGMNPKYYSFEEFQKPYKKLEMESDIPELKLLVNNHLETVGTIKKSLVAQLAEGSDSKTEINFKVVPPSLKSDEELYKENLKNRIKALELSLKTHT